MNVIVRPYALVDRPAIRQICADTADKGGPVEHIFPDREVFADLVTRYYTDFEPGSLWVAALDGQVVGYLTGCLDSRRYLWIMFWRIFPHACLRALFRGVFLHKRTHRFIHAIFKSCMLGGLKRNISFDQYPAHLHVDIKKDFRQMGLGRRLMENFFTQAKSKGINGIYLTTLEDNFRACRFFEQSGFFVLGRYPVVVPAPGEFQINHSVLYVKRL